MYLDSGIKKGEVVFIFKKGIIGFFVFFFSLSISWAQPEGSIRLEQGKVRLIVSPGSSQSGIIKIFSHLVQV